MRNYSILGESLSISTEMENECYLRKKIDSTIEIIPSAFEKWWNGLWDCEDILKKFDKLASTIYSPILQRSMEILQEQKIYNLDSELFINKYASNYIEEPIQILEEIHQTLNRIDDQYKQEVAYRELQKRYRSRVVGGGFGLGGALKGMATAAALNATSGLAHSVGNSIGNAGSNFAASNSKDKLFKSVKEPLRDAVIDGAFLLRQGLRNALLSEAGIECIPVSSDDAKQATVLVQNSLNNSIPDEEKKSMLIKALILNPYQDKVYHLIWENYGDPNFELRELADFFSCDLTHKIQTEAISYGKEILNKLCAPCLTAFNKKSMALRYKSQLEEAKTLLEEYRTSRNLKKEAIPQLNFCNELLEIVDLNARTVNGEIYPSVEIAQKYLHDYKLLSKILVENEENEEDLSVIMKSLPFETEDFKINYSQYIDEEKKKRSADYIFLNIQNLFKNLNLDEEIAGLHFYIPTLMNNFSQVEMVVKKLSKIHESEVPLFLCTLSENANVGLLITDKKIRNYSGIPLLGYCNVYTLEGISSIFCHDDGDFHLVYTDNKIESMKFGKKKINSEVQILLGDLLSHIQELIENLPKIEKQRLYRIYNGVVVCSCGTPLLQGETICPQCKKIKKENGEFVDSMECPHCKNIIPVTSKFCRYCGEKIEF